MPDDLVMNPDPSTQVLSALWACLEQSPAVTSRVKLLNREKKIETLAARQERPDGDATERDYPSLSIVPAGGLLNLTATSTALEAQQNFELVLAAADARLDRQYFPLYWAVVAALAGSLRRDKVNLGLPWVVSVNLRNYTNEQNAQAILQGLTGWSTFLTIEVRLRINHRDIIAV